MTTTRIELLRHGLPEGQDCFRGHTDFPLTVKGFEQMSSSISSSEIPDYILTSPLKRCRDFAYQYAQKHALPLVENHHFMEIYFGDWDGQKKQDIWEKDQKRLSDFWSTPWSVTPPNGEMLVDYDVRINQAWKEMLTDYEGKHILLVTHGGVIKQILRLLLQMPKSNTYLQRFNIPYAAKLTISVYHDENGKQWPEIHWPVN